VQTSADVLAAARTCQQQKEARRGVGSLERGCIYVEYMEDLGNRCALLCELVMDRHVLALNTSAHAQEFFVIAHMRNVQVRLPSAYIDRLF
jgi:hypothetical protein